MLEGLDYSHGSQGILISIAIILIFQLLLFLTRFFIRSFRKKSDLTIIAINNLSEKLTHAINTMNDLQKRIKELEDELKGYQKLREDMKKMKMVIKIISKDQWNEIKEIFYDDI